MASFSKLPYHIKLNIFCRIQYVNLYEVFMVCEEWWWLTMKTYNGILSERHLFIQTLLAFYNRAKQLSTPLMWFELVKYADFSGVKFFTVPGRLVLETLHESRNQIRSVCLLANSDMESIQTRSGDVLKYFPHLQKLELLNFTVNTSFLKIPKGIKRLHLTGVAVDGVAWSNLFDDTNSVQSLELDVTGLIYDHCLFENLKSLSLNFVTPLPVHQMKNILDLIRGHKLLKRVKLIGAKFTKQWVNLFGKAIENIRLKFILIEKQLLNEMGNDRCYERRVMAFVCTEIRTVKRFSLAYLTTKSGEAIAENEEGNDIDYHAAYICHPQLMEETLWLHLDSHFSRQVRTITKTDAGPALKDLHIEWRGVNEGLLTNCVPASVRKFKLELGRELKNLSFTQLCEQPQNVEEFEIVTFEMATGLSILQDCFTSCTHLRILEMTHLNREGLQNLLQHCVSLEKLTLVEPERGLFADINQTYVSETIRELKLFNSDATLEDVLGLFPNLEVMQLCSYLIRPLSMPTAIAKLKLFSATFHGLQDLHENNPSLVLVMNTVNAPCKLFYSDFYKSSFKFRSGWSDSIVDYFYETEGFVYCYGIPTSYLEARGMKILGDFEHFNEKCHSSP